MTPGHPNAIGLENVPDARPISRAYHPTYDAATRSDVLEFLRTKDSQLRPPYAVLCIAHFVQTVLGRSAVCGADVRALFPRRSDALAGPLRNAHDILRRASVRGLVESVGDGWYRITPLGTAVVDALPDDDKVADLRGCRTVTCGVGRRRVSRAD